MDKPKLSIYCVNCKEEHDRTWLRDITSKWCDSPPASAIKQGGVLCLPCTLGQLEKVAEDESAPAELREKATSIVDKMTAIPDIEVLGVRKG